MLQYPEFLCKGLAIGFLLCAPLGPIGLFCVRTTLVAGRAAGMVSVLGASTLDGVYCLIAGLGISSVAHLLSQYKTLFELSGGVVLLLLGIRLFFLRTVKEAPQARVRGLMSAYSSTFLLMLANPLPILAFSAGFAAMGLHNWQGEPLQLGMVVAGAFLGSCLWAPILVTAVRVFRFQFSQKQLQMLNRISGGIFVLLGIVLGGLAALR